MVDYINSWAKGIVIAVIVGTIIEMILPEGNNKKYIKVVIGIYILFVIIYPIITSLTNKTISFDNIIESTYATTTSSSNIQNKNITLDTNKYVEDVYIENMKSEIVKTLENKKYKVENINLIVETENEEKYGEINNIKILISKIKNDKEDIIKENNIQNINVIEKVNINIENNINTDDKQGLIEKVSEEEIETLKNDLSDTYSISIDKIHINEE